MIEHYVCIVEVDMYSYSRMNNENSLPTEIDCCVIEEVAPVEDTLAKHERVAFPVPTDANALKGMNCQVTESLLVRNLVLVVGTTNPDDVNV